MQAMNRRLGNKSLENIVRTDERYGHDGLFLGPRGRDYGEMLEHPKPYQHANLYPDQMATYWFAMLSLPAGSVLTLRGRYPYGRYFQVALYVKDPLGSFTATGEAYIDHEIEPDPGSENPYVPGANRFGEKRDYTLRIVTEAAPSTAAQRAQNTLYAGQGGDIQIVYRVYMPDAGRDGSGDVGLPTYEVTLASGEKLSAEQVRDQLGRPLTQGTAPGMTVKQWRSLLSAPDNDPGLKSETAPARNPPRWEKYFNNQYSLIGVFKSPEVRAHIPAEHVTGFGGDPVTVFLMAFVSRRFDPVYVFRGKMPKFPNTYLGEGGKGLVTMTDWESRYWSVIISEAPPSGQGADALSDLQVPLDADGNYTIVVSRPEDRPSNATEENGIAWMNWGTRGEGIDDAHNRTDFGLLLMRFMYNNPNWEQSPDKVTVPGTEAEIMGPYFPQSYYTSKEEFEAKGPQ